MENDALHYAILDKIQLLTMVPYSLAHIGRLEAQGLFPKRVHLGPSRVGWLYREVVAWVEERAAERE